MEHYDWNDGWLFTPVFDPAIVRPECPELTLEPVRLPHTVKALPYNYCNENDYQKLSGYRREFFAPKEWDRHPAAQAQHQHRLSALRSLPPPERV